MQTSRGFCAKLHLCFAAAAGEGHCEREKCMSDAAQHAVYHQSRCQLGKEDDDLVKEDICMICREIIYFGTDQRIWICIHCGASLDMAESSGQLPNAAPAAPWKSLTSSLWW